jgi:hypothetical protein
VVHALIPLFQSGEAPSRGPRRLPSSTEQTASTFIRQYVIYTHVAIFPGNQEALLTEHNFFIQTGDLFRINLVTKQFTNIPLALAPMGIIVEQSGTIALITSGDTLSRVTLATGEVSVVAQGLVDPAGIALSGSGQFAIVGSFSNAVMRVDLASGTVTTLATFTTPPRFVAIESGDQSVLIGKYF